MKLYAGLTVFGTITAISSALYLSQSPYPWKMVTVAFCPTTANNTQEAQQNLDQKYCRQGHRMLKEFWERKQFESDVPLPENSFRVRSIPTTPSNTNWLLLAPIASGIAYLSWAKKSEQDELTAHAQLENYKTTIKLTTVGSQLEREFKQLVVTQNWDKQKVQSGFISVEAMQDLHRRKSELQDKTHASALKQFDTADAEMQKKISENLRDAAKADKEREALLNGETLPQTEEEHKSAKGLKIGVNPKAKAIDKSEATTWGVLKSLLGTKISSMIIGTTGAGKTVFECGWFTEARAKFPEMELYAIVQKADYSSAIPRENVVYFRQSDPTEALDQIDKVHKVYLDRREKLKYGITMSPVRLLLGDWLSINISLKKNKSHPDVKESQYLSKLSDIIMNGRACNVSLIADLQSFNVEAIGLEADSNVRRNLNILILGNISTEADGTVNDSYGVLENAIRQHHLISEEEIRNRLQDEYKRLKPVSVEHSRPILFSSIHPVTLSLVPDLRHYEALN